MDYTARTTVRNPSYDVYGIISKKKKAQTINPIQEAYELMILFHNTRREMNEFLTGAATIVYLMFH